MGIKPRRGGIESKSLSRIQEEEEKEVITQKEA